MTYLKRMFCPYGTGRIEFYLDSFGANVFAVKYDWTNSIYDIVNRIDSIDEECALLMQAWEYFEQPLLFDKI